MKTIYLGFEVTPYRILLDDNKENEIRQAEEHVRQLKEERKWQTSIEIGLGHEVQLALNQSYQHNQLRVLVESREDLIHTDLGYYSLEQWNTVINDRSPLTLPEVWFSPGFLDGILNHRNFSKSDIWSVIAEKDRDKIVLPLERRTADSLISLKRSEGSYITADDSEPYFRRLLSLCREVDEGKKSPQEIEELFNKRVMEVETFFANKERVS